MTAIPLIARVAGLPADLEGIVLPARHAAFDAFESLGRRRQELALARARAVELLSLEVPRVGAEHRRQVLAWKRDCFNGRQLGEAAPRQPAWAALGSQTRGELELLASLGQELAGEEGELARHYAEQRGEVRRQAVAIAGQREIQRGLCLASLGLMEGLQRLEGLSRLDGRAARPGRKERKAEASLLRYLSRAALKLSPYSTLTAIALARATDEPPAALAFLGAPAQRHSLVRVKRYLLDQCCDQLFLHREIRRHLHVAVNPSLEELGGEVYRFLKPSRLELSEEQKLGYAQAAQVKVRLSGPLVPFVISRLEGRRPTLETLVAEIAGRFATEAELTAEQAEQAAEDLLRLGVICLLTPWPGYHPQLEQNLLSFLHRLPAGAAPAEFLRLLEELVWCEESLPEAQDAGAAVRRIDQLATALYEAARFDRQGGDELVLQKMANRNYYEDVFWSVPASPRGELIELRREALASAVASGQAIWQLSNVFEARHEMLALIGHRWQEKWPGRESVPLLELFAASKAEFETYLARPSRREAPLFDPCGLPEVAALAELRRRIRRGLAELVRYDGETETFQLEALGELVDLLPPSRRSPLGPCLFLQPADREARSWVCNRIFEGTGRMSSRFAVAMPEAARQAYQQHYLERSSVEQDGERLELLDLLFTRSNTVNAHWPQTRKVLVMAGESCDLEPERLVELRDLVVRRRSDGTLRLGDRRGGSYLPCFLSPLQTEFIPAILKFLDLFSCSVRSRTSLSTRTEDRGGFRFEPRQVVGELVVKRKRWIFRRETVPGLEADDAEAFAILNSWRQGIGLPHQVYLIEGVSEPGAPPMFKPQYIDFRSPSFVSLFQTSLRLGGDEVTIDEALPRPEDFPLDAEGRPRGAELMIESLALEESSSTNFGCISAITAEFA